MGDLIVPTYDNNTILQYLRQYAHDPMLHTPYEWKAAKESLEWYNNVGFFTDKHLDKLCEIIFVRYITRERPHRIGTGELTGMPFPKRRVLRQKFGQPNPDQTELGSQP